MEKKENNETSRTESALNMLVYIMQKVTAEIGGDEEGDDLWLANMTTTAITLADTINQLENDAEPLTYPKDYYVTKELQIMDLSDGVLG